MRWVLLGAAAADGIFGRASDGAGLLFLLAEWSQVLGEQLWACECSTHSLLGAAEMCWVGGRRIYFKMDLGVL